MKENKRKSKKKKKRNKYEWQSNGVTCARK